MFSTIDPIQTLNYCGFYTLQFLCVDRLFCAQYTRSESNQWSTLSLFLTRWTELEMGDLPLWDRGKF